MNSDGIISKKRYSYRKMVGGMKSEVQSMMKNNKATYYTHRNLNIVFNHELVGECPQQYSSPRPVRESLDELYPETGSYANYAAPTWEELSGGGRKGRNSFKYQRGGALIPPDISSTLTKGSGI